MELIIQEPGQCPFVDQHHVCGLSTPEHTPDCDAYKRDVTDDCPLREGMTLRIES